MVCRLDTGHVPSTGGNSLGTKPEARDGGGSGTMHDSSPETTWMNREHFRVCGMAITGREQLLTN